MTHTIIETRATQVNMLHRRTNTFGWELQLLSPQELPISLEGENFTFRIIDRRGNPLLNATIGNGLTLTDDHLNLRCNLPTELLDTLTDAHKYILQRSVANAHETVIQGAFHVVDTYHQATLRAHVSGDNTLIKATLQGPPVIKVQSCHVYGLHLKADLINGKVPPEQLPGYLDDIVEYQTFDLFPTTGQSGILYIDATTGTAYRWSGSQYIAMTGSPMWGSINGNLLAQTDLAAALAAKYDSSNPHSYQTAAEVSDAISQALVPFATKAWVQAQEYLQYITAPMITTALGYTPYPSTNPAQYISSAALAPYVPYSGASAHLNLGSNNLVFGAGKIVFGAQQGSEEGCILLPPNGATPTDGLSFGDIKVYRTGTQSLGIESGAALWRINQAIIHAPTTHHSTIRVAAGRTLAIDTGVGAAMASFDGSAHSITLTGNSSSVGNILMVRNSVPTSLLTVANNGRVVFGGASIGIFPSVDRGISPNTGAGGLFIGHFGAGDAGYTSAPVVTIGRPLSVSLNAGSGAMVMLSVLGRFAPATGAGQFNALLLEPLIHQTGSALGITRSLLINPALTAASDHRAIEAIVGNNPNHTLIKLNNGTHDVLCIKGNNQIGFFGATPTGPKPFGNKSAGALYTKNEQDMLNQLWEMSMQLGFIY